MRSVIIGCKFNCASTKTTQLPCDVPLKFLPYLKASQVFAPFYNYLRFTYLIFLTYIFVTATSTNIYWIWNVHLNYFRKNQCLCGGLYGPRANCFLMHKYVHAPDAAEVCELGMCSVLPIDFILVLKRDGFVCPVLHYAYKIRISKPAFWFPKMYLHDWLMAFLYSSCRALSWNKYFSMARVIVLAQN